MSTQQHLPTLRPGDTIGLITPASAVQPEQVEAGIALLTEMGYDCRIAAHAYDNNGITAAPPPARIADFYDFLEDPSVKAIWALRGGYGTIQLLGEIDFSVFARNPKLLVGFSDVTAFQWAAYQQAGFPSLSGMTLTTQVSRENPYFSAGMEIVQGERFSINGEDVDPEDARIIREGSAEGTLIGGTLSMICTLCGTPFWLEEDNLILFLEDIGEPYYRIDRCLQQLRLAGFWPQVAGVILGKFMYEERKLDVLSLIQPYLPPDIPLVYDFPYGHFPGCFPLPVGVTARLDARPFRLSWSGLMA